ncbi:MAG: helix-turn-helix domain-containing protein [Gammaproteobacteria bacterium]|nr:helix-turn-helix domain-containing protein [Gammaproteobacteria bacterium]
MVSLISPSRAQQKLAEHVRARRLALELTQEGLARRSGVSLPSLRKFEQQGAISLEALLKLLLVVGGLENLVKALEPDTTPFSSIDEVLKTETEKTTRKRGSRK